MPVISAAVAAVAVAVATTTVATVAVAVATVAAAVGTLGLAVTAVGMITKNKDLMQAGKIMGYVGLAGGLAGGAIGGIDELANGTGTFLEGASNVYAESADQLSKAWDGGIGSWFSSDAAGAVTGPVGTGESVSGIPNDINPVTTMPASSPPAAPEHSLDAYSQGLQQEELGRQAVQGTQGNLAASQDMAGIAPTAPTVSPVQAVSAPTGPTGPTGYTVPSVNNAVDQSIANAGNVPELPAGAGVTTNPQGLAGLPENAADKAKTLWDSMPDWAKMSMMTTGGQGVAGLASGYFTGATAEERLEFDKLLNAQRQEQLSLQNRNAAYAPSVRFAKPSTGLINT